MHRGRLASGLLSRRVRLVLEVPAARINSVRVRLSELRWNYLLHFRDRDDRQLLDEEQEPHREPAKASGEDCIVHPCRAVAGPLPRLELVRQRWHDDYESLEPHANVDREREDEEPGRVTPQFLGEERQRQYHVAGVQNRRRPPP